MSADGMTVGDLLAQPFEIHVLNNYEHIGLTSFVDHLGLGPEQVRTLIRVEHHQLVSQLSSHAVDYRVLRAALVPQYGRAEVAFIFDSTPVQGGEYGYSYAEHWIPAIRRHGPTKSALRVGDILHLSPEFVWRELNQQIVAAREIPLLATEQYFVVYMTNLSSTQTRSIHDAIRASTSGYLGYVDCSTWNPLKAGLFLPQVGLRVGDQVITDMDDGGSANQLGYPFEESGFRVVGIDQGLYGLFLSHRLDSGVPDWAEADSAMSLAGLAGVRVPAETTTVALDEGRMTYLRQNHAQALTATGLLEHEAGEVASAIQDKFDRGMIYRLRFVNGSRDGEPDPSLDALMYTVQIEFPVDGGEARRFMLGLKYHPADHVSEIVTLY